MARRRLSAALDFEACPHAHTRERLPTRTQIKHSSARSKPALHLIFRRLQVAVSASRIQVSGLERALVQPIAGPFSHPRYQYRLSALPLQIRTAPACAFVTVCTVIARVALLSYGLATR